MGNQTCAVWRMENPEIDWSAQITWGSANLPLKFDLSVWLVLCYRGGKGAAGSTTRLVWAEDRTQRVHQGDPRRGLWQYHPGQDRRQVGTVTQPPSLDVRLWPDRRWRGLWRSRCVKGKKLNFNPFRTEDPKYLFPRGNQPLLYHQIGNRISLFSLQISKTWCFV